MVWQTLALFPFLNARENVEFGLKMRGMDAVTGAQKRWTGWTVEIAEFAERDVAQLSEDSDKGLGACARDRTANLLLDEPLSALMPRWSCACRRCYRLRRAASPLSM